MGILWTERMSVGNAIIDSDHKELIAMINGAEYMIKKRDSYALSLALNHIEYWLHAHFENEGLIAQAVSFPFAKHKLEHENMLKTFCFMREVIEGKDGAWDEDGAKHYAEFLSDWLTNHLLDEDMLMKPVLQCYPYDFRPDVHTELVRPEEIMRNEIYCVNSPQSDANPFPHGA